MKPFDLSAALSGAKLVTRDGREVTDFKFNEEEEESQRISAVVNGVLWTFYENGEFYGARESNIDLFLADEQPAAPKTRTMWVNVYRDGTRRSVSSYLFESQKDAESIGKTKEAYLYTLPIEIPQP